MAEILWPPGLPCFMAEGYSRSRDDALIRSEFPAGTKVRPRFTKAPNRKIQAQMACDMAQLQTINDFWEITCRQGALPFIRKDDTKPDDTLVEYRFLSPPSDEPIDNGALWRVTLQLEQLTTYQGTFLLTDDEQRGLLDKPFGKTLTT